MRPHGTLKIQTRLSGVPSVIREFMSSHFAGGLPLILAISLSGCGTGGNESVVHDPLEYIKASCEYSVDEGDVYATVRSSSPIVTGYFGKTYNKDWLANVGHSSMRDTVDTIQDTGATVYYSNLISEKSCKNFGFATPMPQDISAEWKRVDVRGPKDEFVAGLYLIRGTRGMDALKAKGAIIIREDANRWTLVHEFMHHNFKTQALTKGYDDDLIQARRAALSDQLDGIINSGMSNQDKVKKATPLFLDFLDIADVLVIQYAFEEIAVEATLQDKYDSGDLTFVPAGSYGNATWYINHSKENAQRIYGSLDDLYRKLRELATFSGGRYKEFFQLDKHKEMKEKRLGQLDDMLAERQSKAFRASKVVTLGSYNRTDMATDAASAASNFLVSPCGHAARGDLEISAFAESVRKILR